MMVIDMTFWQVFDLVLKVLLSVGLISILSGVIFLIGSLFISVFINKFK